MGGSKGHHPHPHQDRGEIDENDDDDVLILAPPVSSRDEGAGGGFVFADTRTCWDLEVWIQGALFTQSSACPMDNYGAFVTASIAGKSVSTANADPFGSSVMWNEKLSLGCHIKNEPLVFRLYAGENAKSAPCAQWTMKDWLAEAALNDVPVGGPEENVLTNSVVFLGRANLMVQLASFVHHDPPPQKGIISLDDFSFDGGESIGGLIGGVLLIMFIVFVSLWCCCICCCPRTYQERRRRLWVTSGASTAAVATTSRPPPPPSRPPPPPPLPPSVSCPRPTPPPPPFSSPWYSRPPPFATSSNNNSCSNSRSNNNTGGGGLFSTFYGRPQPYVPSASAPFAYVQSHPQQQQQRQPSQVAVAMPVAEAIGTSNREGGGNVPLAEARVMTSFNAGGGGGRMGEGGGGRQDRGRKFSV
ncbi:hypothetical protein VYU27_005538 [Nannochloropsis oceanica]